MRSREQQMRWYWPSLEHTARDFCGAARLLLLVPSSHHCCGLCDSDSKSFCGAVEEVFLGSLDCSWLLRDEQSFAAWKHDGEHSGKGNGSGQGTWAFSLQEERVPLLICSRAQKRPSRVGCQIRPTGKEQARFLILDWLSYPCVSPLPLCTVWNGFFLLVIEILCLESWNHFAGWMLPHRGGGSYVSF